MRDLIDTNPAIKEAYEAGDDAQVLELLNAPIIKSINKYSDDQPAGMHSNASMGDLLGSEALGTFLLVMQGAIDAQPATIEGQAQAMVLKAMLDRFNTTIYGLDFSNEVIRGTLAAILEGAGVDPAPFLAIGYTMTGLTGATPATQEDLDELRAREAFFQYITKMEEAIENATAWFQARYEADATFQAPVYWDDAKKLDEWQTALSIALNNA